MGLTPKQQRFVAEYAVDLNATQAAIRAGYSEHTAKQQGSRLLSNVDVRRALSNQQSKVIERAEITAADIARVAWQIANDEEAQTGARVSALSLLARRHVEFSDKHDVRLASVDLSRLTDEEIARLASGS